MANISLPAILALPFDGKAYGEEDSQLVVDATSGEVVLLAKVKKP